MSPILLDADYVVYGAGAMGMAFVDVLIAETTAKKVVLVDDHDHPGGHWNDAYPFVHLHQSSGYYGVNSRKLERDGIISQMNLASKNELLAYYEAVLRGFEATGRVRYFPMCKTDDTTSRSFHSLVDRRKVYEVASKAKIVDATYMKVVVPSISSPAEGKRYEVADGVELVPLNALPKASTMREQYVVIGAGKTGMDAVLWLYRMGVTSDRITWVMPRDSWIIVRDYFQQLQDGDANVFEIFDAMLDKTTMSAVFESFEKIGYFQRFDPAITPTKYKCATASLAELKVLRSVRHVVRLGRVKRVEQDKVILQHGSFETRSNTLFVDCSTDGLSPQPCIPIWKGDRITLQSVAQCQQVFSAAVIAHLEARGVTETKKNAMCLPLPHPDSIEGATEIFYLANKNRLAWMSDFEMKKWLGKARLNQENVIRPPLAKLIVTLLFNVQKVMRMMGVKKRMNGTFDALYKQAKKDGVPMMSNL